MKHLRYVLLALGLLVSSQADAGTVYVDTAGTNGALATNSGSTDTTTPTASGTGITCATTTCTITDASINLGTVVTTPGLTQTSINIAGATNTARTLFWVTGVTSGCVGLAVNCVITVDTAPTGSLTGWAVGGRYLWPSGATANVVEGALGLSGGQDAVIFNTTPAVRSTGSYITLHNPGTSTTGYLLFQGKAGVRPKLQTTGNASVMNMGTQANWKISNLELAADTTSGTADIIQNCGANSWFDNVLISSSGGNGFICSSTTRITNSEVTGVATDGVSINAAGSIISGNYIHGNTGAGINYINSVPNVAITDNLIIGNTGRGIYISGTPASQAHDALIEGNTIADNTGVGLEVANTNTVVTLRNNIIYNNNSANLVKWDAGTAEQFGSHGYNVFFSSSTGSLSGLTANSTESTSDPKFVSPGTGNTANYALSTGSSAAGIGWPSVNGGSFPGTGNSASVGYKDLGAFQRQVTAGGQGIIGGGL